MSEEKKDVELKEEELEKVSGGDFAYNVTSYKDWKCPNCGNTDHSKMRAEKSNTSSIYTNIQCRVCWHIGTVYEFEVKRGSFY